MRNKEGLRYPSIDNLLTKIDSKYKLAYASAKRAKKIKEDDYTSVDPYCSKPVGIALEEILQDKIDIEFEEKK
ncbi:DNA-directed RNA polymerase subunit omega [Candidatus Xianfuyuplasma coldseepsis]|uniref:DNA-directed RNA polymerase subunit omega n=1 Tax=Candidatus Xianfuyuplasma coldseepsis TaxID=2782163 RepID=A0A7L7KSH8_9MOLU|nr:DNA-directed RNA polymerase subunit omega [Xianfuyuplasma coldseepsis]QMS85555.1 DNA-directed RNA polymerase subunit omega [Xianfuyuplasma coldseepsis]